MSNREVVLMIRFPTSVIMSNMELVGDCVPYPSHLKK